MYAKGRRTHPHPAQTTILKCNLARVNLELVTWVQYHYYCDEFHDHCDCNSMAEKRRMLNGDLMNCREREKCLRYNLIYISSSVDNVPHIYEAIRRQIGDLINNLRLGPSYLWLFPSSV